MIKTLKYLTALCALLTATLARAEPELQPNYATLDWTVAETLIALGVQPAAIGDVAGYKKWVVKPQLQPDILDLGLRNQPNAEQVIRLSHNSHTHPLHFINSSFYQSAAQTLKPFAMVSTVDFYKEGDAWRNIVTATQQIARLLGEPERAEQLLATFNRRIATLRPQAKPFTDRPIALVQFIDTRHLRIYGVNSPFGEVLRQLGFTNAWQQEVNIWGFDTIAVTRLVKLPADTRFVVVKPYPADIARALTHNTLWQHLPMSQNALVLPAIWTFGGIPSAQRFAETLLNGLIYGGEPW
ncbi:iron-siderophore ABC transporter substrate-binding protein [Pasteurellaceae bacterium LIM206]|nr:iron-siderophore ABC transporter substrate-binding protein [Pasteurellaceae bacterium LIM206]